VKDPRHLLEIERELEGSFVAEEAALDREPKGWPAALIMFHIAQWRGRLKDGLTDFDAGRPRTPPPTNIDELNDQELPAGRGLTLEETSARANAELEALIRLSSKVGDQPFEWHLARTTGDAIVRNSYFHPRLHIGEYWHENGANDRAHTLIESTVEELRELWPSPLILGAGLYNLACVRAGENRREEALDLLEEAAPMRPDLCAAAARESDLAGLRGEARFQAIVRST